MKTLGALGTLILIGGASAFKWYPARSEDGVKSWVYLPTSGDTIIVNGIGLLNILTPEKCIEASNNVIREKYTSVALEDFTWVPVGPLQEGDLETHTVCGTAQSGQTWVGIPTVDLILGDPVDAVSQTELVAEATQDIAAEAESSASKRRLIWPYGSYPPGNWKF